MWSGGQLDDHIWALWKWGLTYLQKKIRYTSPISQPFAIFLISPHVKRSLYRKIQSVVIKHRFYHHHHHHHYFQLKDFATGLLSGLSILLSLCLMFSHFTKDPADRSIIFFPKALTKFTIHIFFRKLWKMPLRYVSARFCRDNPEAYKLCSAGICVDLQAKCRK